MMPNSDIFGMEEDDDGTLKDSLEASNQSAKHALNQADEGEPSGKVMKQYNGVRRKIKKDDSGIGTEKSHENSSEDDVMDQVEMLADTGKGDALPKSTASPSVDSQDNKTSKSNLTPDSGEEDNCSASTKFFFLSSLKDDVTASESANRTGNNAPPSNKAQRTRAFRLSVFKQKKKGEEDELDSDDDQEDEEMKEEKPKMEDKETSTDFDPTPKCPRPKHNWFICKEVINRQYGFPCRIHDGFRQRCASSLHMVERLELMYKMSRHNGCVNALHFNSSGTRLASGSDDLSIIIWDWTISKPLLIYDSGHRSNIFQAKFMPFSNDGMVVSCGRDGQVRVAEISSLGICRSTRKLAQHRGSAHKLAIHDETPKSFLSCGEDAWVFEVDIRQPKHNKLLMCKENEDKVPLYTIHRNPRISTEFAVGGRDHFARTYDSRFIKDNKPLKSFCPHHMVNWDFRANVTCLVYNYNGTELLVSYNDEDIYSFDTRHSDGAEYIHRYKGHRNNQTVKGVNFYGPKSDFVVSGSDCGYIYFWDKETEHIVQSMPGDEGGVVNVLEPHPTFPFLATSGLDDDIKIWVPSCENPPDLSDMHSRICNNMKEREEDRKHERNEPEAIDGQMIWFLMQHLRRTARRRNLPRSNLPSGNVTVPENNPSSQSSSDDDSDEETSLPQAIQCTQS